MNTHGRAYHGLVTAVAMLIEHRLPRAALAGGDIDPRDVRVARARLRRILHEDVPVPLVMRTDDLRARLSAFVDGQALDDAIESVCGPSPQWRAIAADLLGIWQRRSDRVPYEEVDAAVTCTDAVQLGEPARRVFEIFVEQAARTASRAEVPAKLAGADRDALLSSLARRVSEAGLALTEMAWDDITNADVSELRMLAAIAMLESTALLWCQARRAIFESAAMREFAAGVWTSMLGSPRG